MKITIIRAECSKYGQDGVLYINNNPVCDTCEHPERKLPAGEYCLEMVMNRKLQRLVPTLSTGNIITVGNGPFLLNNDIIVGKRVLRGVLLQTSEVFDKLTARLYKAKNRGTTFTLTIK